MSDSESVPSESEGCWERDESDEEAEADEAAASKGAAAVENSQAELFGDEIEAASQAELFRSSAASPGAEEDEFSSSPLSADLADAELDATEYRNVTTPVEHVEAADAPLSPEFAESPAAAESPDGPGSPEPESAESPASPEPGSVEAPASPDELRSPDVAASPKQPASPDASGSFDAADSANEAESSNLPQSPDDEQKSAPPPAKKSRLVVLSDDEGDFDGFDAVDDEPNEPAVRKKVDFADERTLNAAQQILDSGDEGSDFEGFEAESKTGDHPEVLRSVDVSDTTNLIADIFGESDEEGFEGFEQEETVAASAPQPADDAESSGDEFKEQEPQPKQDVVWDFDLIIQQKKQNQMRYRRKRNYDIISDADDAVAQLIEDMKTAAQEDRDLNEQQKPTTKKLKLLPTVLEQLVKRDLQQTFLDLGVLGPMAEWLAPLPDKSLPILHIRESLLSMLSLLPIEDPDRLKASGIGRALMFLCKHPKETKANKRLAGKLINNWSRLVFNNNADYSTLSREQREQRDLEQLPKQRRTSDSGTTPKRDIDGALAGAEKALRPGDPGFVGRARVPAPSIKDYVYRPKSSVEAAGTRRARRADDRLSKYKQRFVELKKKQKISKAVEISIEGRKMTIA